MEWLTLVPVIPMEVLISFFLVSVVLALVPGPDNLFVLTQSVLKGAGAGMVAILGLCTGLLFHMTLVAVGVAAIIQTSEAAFWVLKGVGGVYLLYLAYQTWQVAKEPIHQGKGVQMNWGQLYRRGAFMSATNPKLSIFFLAFLPQFTSPDYGAVAPQVFMLGGLFALAAMVVFGMIAWVAGRLGQWLGESPSVSKILHRFAALVFVGLAAKLLFSDAND